jgi:hypothetical protein
MHFFWNASSVGDKATSVPVMSLLDCSHLVPVSNEYTHRRVYLTYRMCFLTRPREKAMRVAIPRGEKTRE